MRNLLLLAQVFLCLYLLSCKSQPIDLDKKTPPATTQTTPQNTNDISNQQNTVTKGPVDGNGSNSKPPTPIDGTNTNPNQVEPKKPITFDDVIELQKKIVAQNPNSEDEKKRLAMLYLLKKRFIDAEDLLSGLKDKEEDELIKVISAYLYNILGEHREARGVLETIVEKWQEQEGVYISKVEVCKSITSFKRYEPCGGSNLIKPGSRILLYVEPKNFEFKEEGNQYLLSLNYNWELFDKNGELVRLPKWENAPQGAREDRVKFNEKIKEFHQSFSLPLPKNLPMGKYKVKVTVEDANSEKKASSQVEIYVTDF